MKSWVEMCAHVAGCEGRPEQHRSWLWDFLLVAAGDVPLLSRMWLEVLFCAIVAFHRFSARLAAASALLGRMDASCQTVFSISQLVT